MAKRSPLAEKLDEVRGRIVAAAAKASRDPGEITLIAVTKTAAPEQIREILQIGRGGSGREPGAGADPAGGATERILSAARDPWGGSPGQKIRWHLIGHLQRNKVKAVLPLVQMIHSIDSLRLAEELDIQAAKLSRRIPVMLQVNASEESTKFGVAVGAAVHLAEQIDSMPNLQMSGLMAMGPLDVPEEKIRHICAGAGRFSRK